MRETLLLLGGSLALAAAVNGGVFWYTYPVPLPPDPSDGEITGYYVSNIWAPAELIAFAKKEDLDGIKNHADLEKRLTDDGLAKA